MPEGPEVKRCADLIRSQVLDRTLLGIRSLSDRGKFKDLSFDIEFPTKITKVEAYGKAIFISFGKGTGALRSTLGMTGWWYPPLDQLDDSIRRRKVYYNGESVSAESVIEKALKHARFELTLSACRKLLYVDQRNFGNFTLLSPDQMLKAIDGAGIDPLNSFCDDDDLVYELEHAKKPDRAIGEILLDQSIICGVGNIYRAESLYLAGINPHRTLSMLTKVEIQKLSKAIMFVLQNAYQTESSMNYPFDFLSEMIEYDWNSFVGFQNMMYVGHLVYSRVHDILGHSVKADSVGGRTMWWVPSVQK